MEKATSLWVLTTLTLLNAVFSQNPTSDTTHSGFPYKIFSTKMGQPAHKGSYLKYHFVQWADDSLLPSPYRTTPLYARVDSPSVYGPTEIFTLLRKGDSAIVVIPVDALRRHFGDQFPAFLRKKHQIYFVFKVLDVFTDHEKMNVDSIQEATKHSEGRTGTPRENDGKVGQTWIEDNCKSLDVTGLISRYVFAFRYEHAIKEGR